ncbi:MAG: translocation/assembly module TamB domain-containing protein [Rhodovibrionaceae bacterium]|nr:translocation/assembly module TamB domain-containing protein [Rhodovibrionaceae bacterium]
MPTVKRIAWISGLVLLALVVLLAAAGTGGYLWLNSADGRQWLTRTAEGAAADGGMQLAIEGIEGNLPFSASVTRARLADSDGQWLTLEQARVSWRPMALLDGELSITEISADSVTVERLPAADEAEDAEAAERQDAPAELPSLEPPLPIRVERLQIRRLALGEKVVGEAAAFSLDGSLAAEAAGGIRSALSLERLDDAPQTSMRAEAVLDSGKGTLRLDLELTEAEGGFLSGLAELPERPPLRLSLAGEGPLSAWKGTADLQVAEAEGRFELTLEEARRLRLAGSVSPGPFLPENLEPISRGGLELSLDAAREGEQGVRIESLALTSEAVDLRAAGSADLASGDIALEARLVLADDDALERIIAPTRLQSTTLDVSLSGTLASPRAEVALTAEAVEVPDLGFGSVSLNIVAESDQGFAGFAQAARFTAQASAQQMNGADNVAAGLGALLRGPLRLETAGSLEGGDTLKLSTLDLRLPDAQVAGTAELMLAGQSVSADLTVGLDDLAKLEQLAGLPLRGRADLNTRVSVPSFDGRVEADFDGTLTNFAMGQEIPDTLVGERADVVGSMILAENGALGFPRLNLSSQRANVETAIEFSADFTTFTVDARAQVPDAAILNRALGIEMSGALGADAEISGPLADPNVDGEANLSRLDLGDQGLEEIAARFQLQNLATGLNGTISAKAGSAYGPIEAATRLRLGSDVVEFNEIDATLLGVRTTGAVSLPYAGTPIEGELTLAAESLTKLLGQAGLSGDGAADVEVRLSGQDGSQTLRASSDIRSLSLDLDGAPLTTDALRVDLRADDLLADMRFQASLDGEGLAMPQSGVALSRVALSADGNPEAISYSFAAEGDVQGPLDLTGRGTATLGEALQITLAELSGTVLDRPLELRQPLEVRASEGAVAARSLDIGFAGGGLTGDFERDASGIAADIAIDAMPLSLVSLAAPSMEMEGSVSGTVSLQSPGGAATGNLDLSFDGLKLEAGKRAKPVSVRVAGQLANGRLALDAQAQGPWKSPLSAKADLPLVIDVAEGRFALPGDGPITASVDWQGEIEPLFVLLPQDQHVLRGTGQVALRAEGTLDDPEIGGSVSLKNGRYEHLTAGTLLKDLQVRLEAENRVIRITKLSGRDGDGGELTGEGQLEFDRAETFPLNIKAELNKMKIARRDEVVATASGKIGVKGDMKGLEIKGRITVDQAELSLASDLPPDVVELNVTETRDGVVIETREETSDKAEETAVPIALDIQIDMPQKVYIRGRGLDSEWRGNLHIGGTAANPIIEGQMNSVRGEMNLLGKTFKLNPSAVNFLRGPSIDPELDITATHDGEELDVTVSLSGTATNPKLTLSSSPPVPEDEILSRTLFNKPASELTAFETVQLASAIGQLAGGGGGAGIMDMARNLIGVDVLRVGSSDTTDGATLEAGKYITEEVYVGVEQGAASESGAVSVEVDVTPNIKLKSDLSGGEGSNVGVRFQWDY